MNLVVAPEKKNGYMFEYEALVGLSVDGGEVPNKIASYFVFYIIYVFIFYWLA